jgi:hypothetical protein
MNAGKDRTAARGGVLCRRQTGNRGAEQVIRRQKGCRGRRREGKIRRTDLENLESLGVSQ